MAGNRSVLAFDMSSVITHLNLTDWVIQPLTDLPRILQNADFDYTQKIASISVY